MVFFYCLDCFGVKNNKEANNKTKGVIGLKNLKEISLLSILMIGMLSGCHRDIPKPETKVNMADAAQMTTAAITVDQKPLKQNPNRSLLVQHKIKGNQVFVECILTGISFRETDHAGQEVGKLVVWVDGIRTNEITSAAFIMKNLSPGNHKVKLEVVNLRNEPYGLSKEFLVNIPK